MLLDVLMFLTGLILLYFGAEALVGGSSTIALKFGVRPLVVGLTVVAFGTSSPELVVCLTAAIDHTSATDAISIGNIIGSNIANIALIMGVASLIKPIQVTEQAVRREYPLMLAASVLLVLLVSLDGQPPQITRLDGGLLFGGMLAYLAFTYYASVSGDSEPDDPAEEPDEEAAPIVDEVDPEADTDGSMLRPALKIAFGIGGLAIGAYWMVEASVDIATAFGVPEVVIGISMVALGTSLPELATSVIAVMREESDISVGNVIGSNIFNILLVLGLVALVAPIDVDPDILKFDLWMMLGVAIGIWPILRTGYEVDRLEGALMLIVYVGYIALLFMR
jgi:cation:H+ antiporter